MERQFNSTWSLGGLSGMAGCWFHCVDSKNARAFRRGKRLRFHSDFNILQPWSKNEATSDISQSLRALNRVSAPIFGQLPHFGDPRMIPEVHIFLISLVTVGNRFLLGDDPPLSTTPSCSCPPRYIIYCSAEAESTDFLPQLSTHPPTFNE